MEGTFGDMTKFLQSWLTLRNKCEETKGNEGRQFVNFVKEGEIGPRAGVEENGLLRTATNWKMRVDLKQRMKFPSEIAVTNKRPDIVI